MKKGTGEKQATIPTGPLGEGGETKTPPEPPKSPPRPPKSLPRPPENPPRALQDPARAFQDLNFMIFGRFGDHELLNFGLNFYVLFDILLLLLLGVN